MKLIIIISILINGLLSDQLIEDSDMEILKPIYLVYQQDKNVSERVIKMSEDACEIKNIAQACEDLQKFYVDFDTTKAEAYKIKSYKINSKKCMEGNFKSCMNIGRLDTAESIAKSKCNDTTIESCKDVIVLADKKLDVVENIDGNISILYTTESADLYSHACRYGHKMACSDVNSAGVQFSKESNSTENLKIAISYYRIACDSKNGEEGKEYACRNIAMNYDKLKEYQNSHPYYIKSCQKKNTNSCYDVGINFYFGYGIEKNLDNAYPYLKDACELKLGKSCEYIAEIDKIRAEIKSQKEAEEKARLLAIEEEKKEKIRIENFRKKKFQEGDQTNCGPVIEVKTKMLKIYFPVQSYGNEHWIMKDTIYPAGYGCQFYNGRYVTN